MRNGQLKPAYNVQIAVNSEYITGVDVFSNRTDFGTLVPFLKRLQQHHETKYKEVTADAGYESLENYQYSCLVNPHGWRSLVSHNPWGHKASDATE